MPDTFTPILNLTQPEVGASDSTWGTKLNADLATLDALFAATGTGTIIRRDASDNAATVGVVISKAAGNGRRLQFQSAGSSRWDLTANSVAEGGSNTGSDFTLTRYNDAGASLGAPVSVSRATGQVTFETTPQVGANAIFHASNSGALSPGVGEIRMWGGGRTADPNSFWMIANGRALDRTTYAVLFAVYGTTYGAGNGSTTFNIPNFEERGPIGQSAAQTLIPQFNATVLGGTFGEGRHSITQSESANWTVTGAGTTLVGAPRYTRTDAATGGNALSGSGIAVNSIVQVASVDADITNFRVDINPFSLGGGGQAHNNVQPSLVINFIVRVL